MSEVSRRTPHHYGRHYVHILASGATAEGLRGLEFTFILLSGYSLLLVTLTARFAY